MDEGRIVSIKELLSKKRDVMQFTGKWLKSFGKPEKSGSILVWGLSGQGKTRFTLQFCQYLMQFGKVLYYSLEERDGDTIARAIKETGIDESEKRISLYVGGSIEELKKRLQKHKSADIIVIDSLQYTGMSYADYIKLKETFIDKKKKLFIYISHAKGKEPKNEVADAVRSDANIKIRVDGYKAYPASRCGGDGEPFVIWEEGATKHWGLKNNKTDNYENRDI